MFKKSDVRVINRFQETARKVIQVPGTLLIFYLKEVQAVTWLWSVVACNKKEDSLADYNTAKAAIKNLKLEEFRLHIR